MEIRRVGRTGPGRSSTGKVLKRVVNWSGDGFTWEANPRLTEKLINMLNLSGAALPVRTTPTLGRLIPRLSSPPLRHVHSTRDPANRAVGEHSGRATSSSKQAARGGVCPRQISRGPRRLEAVPSSHVAVAVRVRQGPWVKRPWPLNQERPGEPLPFLKTCEQFRSDYRCLTHLSWCEAAEQIKGCSICPYLLRSC